MIPGVEHPGRWRVWLEERAERQPFTERGERRRRWLHQLAHCLPETKP